jgi:hypothetical protein
MIFGHNLVKTTMEQSFANENMISGNDEAIEICMNDVVWKMGIRKFQVSK